jgi:hypothetical protein
VSQRRGSKRGTGWKPPRDRKEVVTAVLASLAVIVVTAALVWFLRPNRDSGSSSTPETVTTPTTLPSTSVPNTSLPSDSTVAPTTAPAATSTP